MKQEEIKSNLFEGLRSEVLVLVAGILSFQWILNHSLSFFDQVFFIENIKTNLILFALGYFVLPSLIITGVIINARHLSGKWIEANKIHHSLKVIGKVNCGALLLACTTWILGTLTSLSVNYILVALFVVWLSTLFIFASTFFLNYRNDVLPHILKLYGQIQRQFLILFTIVSAIGLVYMWQFYHDGKLTVLKTGINQKVDGVPKEWCEVNKYELKNQVRHSYEKYTQYDDTVQTLHNQITFLNSYLIETESYKKEIPSELQWKVENFKVLSSPIHWCPWEEGRADREEYNKVLVLGKQYEEKVIRAEQIAMFDLFRWTRVNQFTGVGLFLVMLCSLLCHWFLKQIQIAADQRYQAERASKPSIVRWSIYLIILLIIPFFKPVAQEDINLDHPFVPNTASNALSLKGEKGERGSQGARGDTGKGIDEKVLKEMRERLESLHTNDEKQDGKIDGLILNSNLNEENRVIIEQNFMSIMSSWNLSKNIIEEKTEANDLPAFQVKKSNSTQILNP